MLQSSAELMTMPDIKDSSAIKKFSFLELCFNFFFYEISLIEPLLMTVEQELKVKYQPEMNNTLQLIIYDRYICY